MVQILILLPTFAAFSLAHADALLSDASALPGALKQTWNEDSFMIPNERFPEEARSIWNQARPGLYVSVGTERSFIGASNVSGTQALLLVDRTISIVHFNDVLIALLQAAHPRSLKDFLYLRFEASFQEWKSRSHQPGVSSRSSEILKSSLAWKWWKKFGGNLKELNWQHFFRDSLPLYISSNIRSSQEFRDTLYTSNEVLFHRLEALAKNGMMTTLHLDLRKEHAADRILHHANRLQIPLSVLDLSNAIEPAHIGKEELKILLEKIFLTNPDSKTSQAEAILLATHLSLNWERPNPFPYRGFRGRYIQDWGSIHEFVEALPKFFNSTMDKTPFLHELPHGLRPGSSCLKSQTFFQLM